LRKHFLHFLHAKTISNFCSSGWLSDSWWHSTQSNHFRPTACFSSCHYGLRARRPGVNRDDVQQGDRIETCALRTCLLAKRDAR
jgi:hypothetical protein